MAALAEATLDQICVNHTERQATHLCDYCNAALCFDCMDIVKGRHACKPCEEKQEGSKPRSLAADTPHYAKQPSQTKYPTGILVASVCGFLAALATGFVWEKMVFFLHIQFMWINIFLGAAVGIAVLIGMQKTGPLAGVLGCFFSLVSMLLGHIFLAQDMIKAAVINDHLPAISLTVPIFRTIMGTMTLSHWFYVLLGIAAGTAVPWKIAAGPGE